MAVATAKSAPVSAQAAAQAAQQMNQQRHASNLDYLMRTVQKKALCPPSAGAGLNQAIAAGTMLPFDVPTINGAFAESLLFKVAATVNPATGTAATYALNAFAPWTIIDHVVIRYGKQQVTIQPYLLKTLARLMGYERSDPMQVNAGASVAALTSTIWGTPFNITTNTNNAWNFWFRIPLRWLGRSAAGMLPTMGGATTIQVEVYIATNGLGFDPLQAPVATTGGTGAAVTLGGTVAVEVEYRDGTNYDSPSPLGLDLTGLGTFQIIKSRPINPLTAGTVLRQRFGEPLKYLFAISTIVDGVQSTSASLQSNHQVLELDQDFNGDNAFWRYGLTGSNIGITEYYERIRAVLGQDLDQGVIPWVPGPAFNGVNPDNQEGGLVLNAMPGGWPDATFGVQVAAVNATNIVPRIETTLVAYNPAGLVAS